MNEFEAFEIIKKQLCKEVIQLAEQIQKNGTMSTQDLDKLDKIYHTKKNMFKSLEAEEALDEDMPGMMSQMSGTNQNGNGNSGYRGRAANGRFVSRANSSYADGYSQGYSEAMNQMSGNNNYSEGYNRGYSEAMNSQQNGNSGHYPMMPYGPRRW